MDSLDPLVAFDFTATTSYTHARKIYMYRPYVRHSEGILATTVHTASVRSYSRSSSCAAMALFLLQSPRCCTETRGFSFFYASTSPHLWLASGDACAAYAGDADGRTCSKLRTRCTVTRVLAH